ncbi:iron complex transport system substrate-binding protein [Herbihabitans rhizosphaerae]|uniref:Iron complex transport system substrate-binding protein n=1 Tax=Herbihabitans rhizosphaerae TaxID=1872711 RepID=A0A4Q7L5P7_9PSEU|nr:ABC transporter substrate-binding protein [Herbihabitans rhizosphaerae]RZS44604.1 iron complex transport system substrate-binding protein [Herbihabitans rhizosphaerae]
MLTRLGSVLIALVLLAGCGGAGASGNQGQPSALTLTGPATARIADEDVRPIATGVQPRLPVTVRSHDGAEVRITSVDRIVAVDLYGTLGEIVFSLGLGRHLVGRDSATGFPSAAHVPVVTSGGHDLNAEAILDLNPTVVLTDTSIGPPEVQQQLRASGIPVVYFNPRRTLAAVPDHIRSVAAALGVPDVGEKLIASVNGEIAAARALATPGTRPPRLTFLYVRGSAGVYLMAGPGSGADEMIKAVGAVDVGTDIKLGKPFVSITSEGLLNAAPDVILVMSAGLASVGGIDGLLRVPGVAQTPAGQARRIVDIDDTDLLSFGPRVGRTITALATVLYGGR